MWNKRIILVSLVSSFLVLTACTDPNDPNRQTKTGAAIGAVAGAVLGHQIHHDRGRYWGAALGALAGAGVGRYMDNQQAEFEKQLAEEQAANQIEIERLKDETLRLIMDSEVSFDFDSADIKSAWMDSLDKLADVINRYPQTVVHVVGHTDSIGSESYNQVLSERRALSVGNYLMQRGVDEARVYTEGRGELEPRDTNSTEAGRQLNRRVEIFIKPIVEGQEEKAHEPPKYY